MDWILPAVAEAISEVEREAAEAQEDPQAEAYEAHEASTTGGIHESREANAGRLASAFLQSMESTSRYQPEGAT